MSFPPDLKLQDVWVIDIDAGGWERRRCVIVRIEPTSVTIVFGRGRPHGDKLHLRIDHPTPDATAMGLTKPTHFRVDSFRVISEPKLFNRKVGRCPDWEFITIEELFEKSNRGVK